MSSPTVRVLNDAEGVAEAAADRVIEAATTAVAARGVFHLCTTGGSTPAALYRALREPARAARMPWTQTQIWFGDDRFVPRADPLSNVYPLDTQMLSASADGAPSPLSPSAVHPWPTSAADAPTAVSAYLEELRGAGVPHTSAGFPIFDLVLIGIGGDGHCLSVFPGSPLALDGAPVAAGVPAPTHIEPHLPRLSFSLGVLASAREVLALAPGAGKAEALARIFSSTTAVIDAPAKAALIPTAIWLLDTASAAILPS
ncbi:MAG: 6-phosphogluconolactonase [Chloroflexi bacterium]|nr:6-phosphogluconolactonase [Chloroflexota bacterium]